MGKANRIKSGRNSSASAARNSKNKSSFAYTLALALVAVFVAAVIIVSAVLSTGVIMRSKKAIYTEDYTVSLLFHPHPAGNFKRVRHLGPYS